MKVAILLTYYERPKIVRNALQSVLESHEHHQDWRLLFGDDGSKSPGELIAREVLKDHLDKVDFVNSHMTVEDKLRDGIAIGRYANEYLAASDSDIVVTLCDDDMLRPGYTKDLCEFFLKTPDSMYCYSDVIIYNPIMGGQGGTACRFNYECSGNPAGKLDASQVAFRTDCFRQGCRFPTTTVIGSLPCGANVDAGFYQQLYDRYGEARRTGFVGQYKGIHDYQLVWHKKQGALGLRDYIERVEGLAGKVL